MRTRVTLAAATLALLLGACGGDDDADDGQASQDTSAPTGQSGAATSAAGNSTDGADADQPTLTTDPGTAVAEVGDDRLVYEAAGSLAYLCDLGPDRAVVNFQTADGQDLSIQATRDGDGWQGQLSFRSADAGTTQYSAVLGQDGGILAVGDDALSYDGTVDRVEDFDVANAETVAVKLAVNCAAAAGGDPQAVIDGTTYVVPLSGAQSVTCAVSPGDVDVRINRLAIDNLQLAIDLRGGPDDWLGSVSVITPDGDYSVTLTGAAEGLTIGGDTVTYEGPIDGEAGTTRASISVTCP